jgi:hypothetical protein
VRAVAEEAREAAESERSRAEVVRAAAEEAREAAESERNRAEAERAAAEQRRDEALAKQKQASGVEIADEGGRFESGDVEGALGELAESIDAQSEAVESLKTRVDGSFGVFGKLTLKKDDFDSGIVAEAEVVGAGALDLITFYPESAEDAELSASAGLFILPNAAFGRVIFTARKLPERDLNFCYFITKGGAENE